MNLTPEGRAIFKKGFWRGFWIGALMMEVLFIALNYFVLGIKPF